MTAIADITWRNVRIAMMTVGVCVMAGCSAPTPQEPRYGVGITTLILTDIPTKAAVFYPSDTPVDITSVGPYDVGGILAAEPARGRFPVIALSHGSGGGSFSHHGLGSFLAQHGYVVVAIEHPLDNHRDRSGAGSIAVHRARTQQIKKLIDRLTYGELAESVDLDKVGFIGYSAGTVTGLALAGWPLSPHHINQYCASRKSPPVFCRGLIAESLPFEEIDMTDSRIKSFLLLAPMGIWFDRRPPALRKPVGLIIAEHDEELGWDANVSPVVNSAEKTILFEIIPNAGHSTFLSPCSQRLSLSHPDICEERWGANRKEVHERLKYFALNFFNRTL